MASAMRKMAVYLGLVEDERQYQDGYDAYGEYDEYDEQPEAMEMEEVAVRTDYSAYVAEAPLGHARLVLRCHLDVRGGQQEHLVRHLVEGPAQAEDQPGREVDKTACVAVDHLGQVHDHRGAFTEVLTDGPGFIVGARMECGNPGQLHLS